MTELKDLLESTFPIPNQQSVSSFLFFPICNEFGFNRAIGNLMLTPSSKDKRSLKVAILFGESHFLSLLPTLSNFVDMILLADIEMKLHAHNRHLLSTFKKADTISQFLNSYCDDFPSAPFERKDIPTKHAIYDQVNILLGKKSQAATSLQTHHFLNNIRQYQSCKQALEKLTIVHIQLDLADIIACSHLASLLQEHDAEFAICNFTNIHQYVNADHLFATTKALLTFSNPDAVVYSTGPSYHLNVFCAAAIEDYYTVVKNSGIRPAKYTPRIFDSNNKQNDGSIDATKPVYQTEPSSK